MRMVVVGAEMRPQSNQKSSQACEKSSYGGCIAREGFGLAPMDFRPGEDVYREVGSGHNGDD